MVDIRRSLTSLLASLRSLLRSDTIVNKQSVVPVSTRAELDDAVISYLKEPDPTVALLLSGKWGAGKTYYLTTSKCFLESASGKRLVVVSVAGLSTRSELDQAIFMASAPWLFSGYTQALGVFFKAGLRFAKIEPSDFRFSPDFEAGNVVVVLEDMDRFLGDARVVSGLIIDLVDQSRLHTIVVASEDNMKHFVDFGTWKEKIIGTTIKVVPDQEAMLDAFTRDIADEFSRGRLGVHRKLFASLVSDWGLGNLRAMRHAIKDVARVISAIGPRISELEDREETLLGGLFLGLLEIKRDSQTADAVSKVFSGQGLSESALARLAGIDVSEDNEADDGVFVARLLQRYSSYEFSLFPGGKVFAQFFDHGYIDTEAMLAAFVPAKDRTTRRSQLLSDYLKLSQYDFDEEVASVIYDLERSAFASMGELAQWYFALRFMSERKAIDLTQGDVARLIVSSANGVDPLAVTDSEERDDDMWFMERRDDQDRSVQEALNKAREAARAARTEVERLAVFSDFDEGPALLERLQSWKLRPLFIGDPVLLVEKVMLLRPHQVQDLMRLFGSRRSFSNFGKVLREEKDTLREMSAILKLRIPKQGVLSIRDSQLNQLADAMAAFADDLQAYDDTSH